MSLTPIQQEQTVIALITMIAMVVIMYLGDKFAKRQIKKQTQQAKK